MLDKFPIKPEDCTHRVLKNATMAIKPQVMCPDCGLHGPPDFSWKKAFRAFHRKYPTTKSKPGST